MLGLPSSGLHSNGYTLARQVLADLDPAEDPDGRLAGPSVDVLLEPTEIYVRAVLELLRSEVDVRASPKGDAQQLTRLAAPVGYEIDDPLPVPPIFDLIRELGEVADDEMYEVFNMGCGSAAWSASPTRRQRWTFSRAAIPAPGASGPSPRARLRRALDDRPQNGQHVCMRIAILIFDQLTALDAVGPYEVLSPARRGPAVRRQARREAHRHGALALTADVGLADLPDPEIVLVPGGEGNRRCSATTRCSTGCAPRTRRRPGRRRSAPARWCRRRRPPRGQARHQPLGLSRALRAYGAEPVDARVVEDGKVVTAAGVSSGIDMALTLRHGSPATTSRRRSSSGSSTTPTCLSTRGAPPATPELVELIRSLENAP